MLYTSKIYHTYVVRNNEIWINLEKDYFSFLAKIKNNQL